MDQKKSLKAAIITAVLASICCVGPLVLLALGISGAWIGNLSALEPYRPFFMLITALFLGYAFYKIYRKPKAEECEPGSYCANPKSDKINKISLWTVTLIVVVLFSIPYLAKDISQRGNQTNITTDTGQTVNLETVVLSVPGMHCASCPLTVRTSLEKVKGVNKAEVLYEQRLAIVKFDPSQTKVEDLIAATTNAGYPSTIIQNNPTK